MAQATPSHSLKQHIARSIALMAQGSELLGSEFSFRPVPSGSTSPTRDPPRFRPGGVTAVFRTPDSGRRRRVGGRHPTKHVTNVDTSAPRLSTALLARRVARRTSRAQARATTSCTTSVHYVKSNSACAVINMYRARLIPTRVNLPRVRSGHALEHRRVRPPTLFLPQSSIRHSTLRSFAQREG